MVTATSVMSEPMAVRQYGGRPSPTRVARGDFILNATLRAAAIDAVDRRGWRWTEIAQDAGIDVLSLRRSLGMGTHHGTRYVRYDRAVAIARALGIDPVDVSV